MGISSTLVVIIAAVLLQAVCATFYCKPPSAPQYGGFTPAKKFYFIGKRVEFFCNDGYELVGVKWTVCLARKGWAHRSPICRPISCPDLDDPQYGSVRTNGNRPGSRADYKCDDGFRLVGQAWRKCQSNGQWTGEAPKCIPITCPDLDDPRYGSVRTNGNRPGNRADYKCNDGFRLVGQAWRKCQSNGQWTGEAPKCIPITCPDLDDPRYGSVRTNGNRPGSRADYKCDDGFRLVGQAWRKCQSNGQWTGEAPKCIPITCPDLDDPRYGSVRTNGNRPGSRADYKCDDGFRLVGQAWRKCQSNGQWTGEAPKCVAIYCPDLDDPRYGDVDISSRRVGGVAKYSCKRGFRLQGDSKRTCGSNGKWDGEEPKCIPITCSDLDDPDNGNVKISSRRIGGVARHFCNRGFSLVGNFKRVCLRTGEWSGEEPKCVVDCGKPPFIKFGFAKFTSTLQGSKAFYTCKRGFYLKGDKYRVCLPSGKWGGYNACVRVYH